MTTNSPIAPTNRQATKPFRRIEFATPSTSTANFTMIQAFEQLYLPQRPNIATATVECNRRQLQTCKSVMGDIPVGQITRDTLIQYRDKRLCEKSGSVSTLSINNDLKLLRRVLHAAGYFPDGHNVAIPLGLPVHAITLEDLTRLWNLVDQTVWPGSMAHEYRGLKIDLYPGAWWRALLMLAYSTGIRRGDLFLLRWEQLDWQSILLEFDGDARPKRIPITGPLRPWLHILRQNNSPTVLGHLDGNEFDKEIGRLRTLSGISHFGLHTLRCLAVHQWEQASPGCGALIRNHKEGATVSEANFRRLATAADLLTYPPEILAASIPADKSKPFLDPQRDPFEPVPISEDKKRQAEAAQPDSSLATFKNFFSPGESSAPTRLESMTLRDVFETSLRPILETDGRTDSTMSGYRLALTHWERLTSNPLINEITTAYLQQFRKSAKDELHRSPASCNSWFRSLRSILNHLGQRRNFNARSWAALAF
ncbi:MAG: integrase family protein [Planctomycetaceae bacterium]|nr:integrase family protein [Planctomycetaceae bacterium]